MVGFRRVAASLAVLAAAASAVLLFPSLPLPLPFPLLLLLLLLLLPGLEGDTPPYPAAVFVGAALRNFSGRLAMRRDADAAPPDPNG